MVVTALPDLAGAIVAYLRASAPVAAIVGTKVSAVRQESWALPAYAVLVETGRGGPGEIDYGPLQDALISPDQSHPVGFVAASTRVLVIYQEGGPLRLTDPDTNWPYTTTPYRFRYSGVPAA
jgi:hypothetical protein